MCVRVSAGKAEDVVAAKRGAAQQLQKRAETVLQMPREYQRRLLRRSGDAAVASSSAGATRSGMAMGRTRLQEVEALTNTRIQLPPATSERTEVHVSGPRDGVERARIELERFVQLQVRGLSGRRGLPHLLFSCLSCYVLLCSILLWPVSRPAGLDTCTALYCTERGYRRGLESRHSIRT